MKRTSPDRQSPIVAPMQLGVATAAPQTLAGLHPIGERIARGLSDLLLATGGTDGVFPLEPSIMPFAEWKAGLSAPMAVARYRDQSIKGGFLFAVPTPLILANVDRFYGGTGAIDSECAAFGAAEARFFERFAKQFADVLVAAWAGALPLSPVLAGTSAVPHDLVFGKPQDRVVVQTVACSHKGGEPHPVTIIYPLSALKAVTMTTDVEPKDNAADPAWRTSLHDAIMNVRLPVRTVIARPTVSLARLMTLAPGDFIPVKLPARVPLTAAGCLLAHGTIGEANGSAAIQIDMLEQGGLLQ